MHYSLTDTVSALSGRYPIDDDLVLGLDIGIASVGSALVKHGKNPKILFVGSRGFEPSEEPKTKKLKNQTRREKRGLRRVIRRRAQRMRAIRAMFVSSNLLDNRFPDSFHNHQSAPDPWRARAEGLDRGLTNSELAAALLHIAKHRGFKSNKKSDAGKNAPDDNKKMLGAIADNQALLSKYRTVGEMAFKDPKFDDRKRNRADDYGYTQARDDLQNEVRQLFQAQRRFGNRLASETLEQNFVDEAFFQRALQDSDDLVGFCVFETEQRRCAKAAPSFELFRFLSKLNHVRVRQGHAPARRLTVQELSRAVDKFGTKTKSIKWKALAKTLALSGDAVFEGIDGKAMDRDVAASQGCAMGTKTFFDVLGPSGWNALNNDLSLLDRAAEILTFRDDLESIEKGLRDIPGLPSLVADALVTAAREGDFAQFKGTGHISAKAARAIIPHLLDGQVYSDACASAGYDHAAQRRIEVDDIKNPVVQRSMREAVKQCMTLIHEFKCRPGRIVVELARDVGKSAKERDEMTKGIDKRHSQKEKHRSELAELLKLSDRPSEDELLRYELWKEQKERCILSDSYIPCADILSDKYQIEHILPRSLSQDNSYNNKILSTVKANQDKGRRTPWQWRGHADPNWWEGFETRVRALNIKGMKKRNLLMRNFEERQQGFVERNLNDTRYVSRALLAVLKELYNDRDEPDPADSEYLSKTRRLFSRPGQITAILRRAWGLDRIKDRADDRHHGLDALICAAGKSEWLLNMLTREYQKLEEQNRARWAPPVPPPWDGFREDAIHAYDSVFVSRSEKRRARGEGHAATIYGRGEVDGKAVTYERKAVANLTKADLKRLKDADGGNMPLADALAAWLEAGKPQDAPPLSPKGDPIKKVRLVRSSVSGFPLNGGHVDNGDMVRVDVFSKPNKKGKPQYYLVPIYRHQVMTPSDWPTPPNRAVVAYKSEQEWTLIDTNFAFHFSLFPNSYVEIIKPSGELIEGYYRGMDRATAAINISPQNLREIKNMWRSIGVKSLISFQKFTIDRLGRKFRALEEKRQWRGADCT